MNIVLSDNAGLSLDIIKVNQISLRTHKHQVAAFNIGPLLNFNIPGMPHLHQMIIACNRFSILDSL